MITTNDPMECIRVALGVGLVLSNVIVWIGVYLENDRFSKETQAKGWRLLLVGLAAEAAFAAFLFVADTAISVRQKSDIESTRSDLAKAGVAIGELTGTIDGMDSRLKHAEDAIKQLQNPPTPAAPSILPSSPPVLPAEPLVPPIKPVLPPVQPLLPPSLAPVPYLGAAREVDAEAIRIIHATTLPGAIVSVIPFMLGEPQNFANELGAAFSGIPTATVAVGIGNLIMNDQRGLIVQYDHSNPVSSSVFEALVKAGLNPVEGPATPGTPIVFIKVAPQ